MKPLRIFRHEVCESPGYLSEFLNRQGAPWDMVCLDQGVAVPGDLEDVSGLIFMGGNMSVNDPLEWIGPELELIRRAHSRELPMLGICFGGQLISKALGGRVMPNPKGMEVGWHAVRKVADTPTEDWLAGLPEEIVTFHWHAEAFELPPGSHLLMENACYHYQAYALGDSLGLQFHLEMNERMIKNWLHNYGRTLDHKARCIQGFSEITRDLSIRVDQLHQVADTLFGNWLARVRQREAA